MSTCDTFVARHPVAARRVTAAATVVLLLLPGAIGLAILSGHPALAIGAALASSGSYAVGYTAAAIRYRCRGAVVEARRDPLAGLPNLAGADAMRTARSPRTGPR